MPRRKQTTINLKKLKSYRAMIDELRNNPAFADKDLIFQISLIKFSAKVTKKCYKVVIFFVGFGQ